MNARLSKQALRVFLLAVMVASCAHNRAKPPESLDDQIRDLVRPVPSDLRAQVAQAERIGATLYAYDSVAWIATDALLGGRHGDELGLGGYVVFPEGDASGPNGSWQTEFYSAEEPQKILFRVHVSKDLKKARVEELQPPEELRATLNEIVKARTTAIQSIGAPDQPINPVVLPGEAIGEHGILVYLLAGTTQPKHVVFGRHYRILISSDGTRVLRSEPLSKTALVMPLESESGLKPAALIVSHLVSSTPVETHVLASMQHHIRVLVATDRGDWVVDGPHITYLGPREP